MHFSRFPALIGLAAMLVAVSAIAAEIHEVALKGDAERLRALLGQGARPDSIGPEGVTPLLAAARGGKVDAARVLLAAGADPGWSQLDGTTFLMWAAHSGSRELVEIALENKAEVNATNATGITALIGAAAQGHTEIAKLLMAHGADPKAKTKDGRSAFFAACQSGEAKTAKLLLSADSSALNAQDNRLRETPLFAAIAYGRLEVVRFLLDQGANPSLRPASMAPALQYAVMARARLPLAPTFANILKAGSDEDYAEIARLLVEKGEDPKWKTNHGESYLYSAAAMGSARLVKLFLSIGLRVNEMAATGQTPLHAAAMHGNVEVVKMLLEAGADPKVRDAQDFRAAHYAALGRPAALKALLAAERAPSQADLTSFLRMAVVGANSVWNPKEAVQETAQFPKATGEDYLAVIDMLLAAGADPKARAAGAESPLKLAAEMPPVLQRLKTGPPKQPRRDVAPR